MADTSRNNFSDAEIRISGCHALYIRISDSGGHQPSGQDSCETLRSEAQAYRYADTPDLLCDNRYARHRDYRPARRIDRELSKALPTIYRETIEPALSVVFEFLNRVAQRLDRVFGQGSGIFADDFGGFLTSVRNSLGSAVSDISMKLLSRISGFAAGIPGVVVQVLFAVISSFFFTLDFESILSYLKAHLPDSIVKLLSKIRGSSLKTLGRYARSYALIMLITFAELSLGLLLIGVKHPFAAAFAIAMFDILPVLGTGGILVPWALVRLLCGDLKGFIGLLALWAVISVVRNIIEPKIVGRQVGLHPLATLISMYVGTKLFGVIGLFMLPIGLSVWISTKNEYEAKAPLDKNG